MKEIRNTSQKVIDILYDIRRMRNPRPISFTILIQCEMLVYSCLYVYVCVCSCIQFSARFQFTKIDNTIKKENRLNLSQTRNARCIYGNVNIFVRNSTQKVDFSINKEKEKLIFLLSLFAISACKKFLVFFILLPYLNRMALSAFAEERKKRVLCVYSVYAYGSRLMFCLKCAGKRGFESSRQTNKQI